MQNKLDNGLKIMSKKYRIWFKREFHTLSITSQFNEVRFTELLGLLNGYQNIVCSDFVIKCIETVCNSENNTEKKNILLAHLLSLVKQNLGEERVKFIELHFHAKPIQPQQTDISNEPLTPINQEHKLTINKKPVKILTQPAKPSLPASNAIPVTKKTASTAEPKPAPKKSVSMQPASQEPVKDKKIYYPVNPALKPLLSSPITLPEEICENAAKISKLLKLENNTLNLVGTYSRYLISSQLNLPDFSTLKEYPIRSLTFWVDGNFLKESFPVNDQVNKIDEYYYRINGMLADKEVKVLTFPDAQFGQFLISRVCLPLSRDDKNSEFFTNTANIKATTIEWRHSTHKELFLRQSRINVKDNNHIQDTIAQDPACILKFHREKVKGLTKVGANQEKAFKMTEISNDKLESCAIQLFEQCHKDAMTYGKGNPEGYINDLKEYASIKKLLDYATKLKIKPDQPKPSSTGFFATKPKPQTPNAPDKPAALPPGKK